MIAIFTGDTEITFADPSNPTTNFVKLSATEPSLFEMGITVGQQFQVDNEGSLLFLRLKPLTAAQIEQRSAGDVFKSAADGHLYYKLSSGSFNITG